MLFVVVKFAAKSILRLFDFFVGLVSDNRAFLDGSDYYDLKELFENNYQTVRDEFISLNVNDLSALADIFKEQKVIAERETWKSLMLVMFGYSIPEHLALCPKTSKLVVHKKISSAMFSVLKAGQAIKPHIGIYKGVIRAHLPIIVPEGDCFMMLDGKQYHWEEGQLIYFDDTYTHQVSNNTNKDRIVLFLDVIRPLPFTLSMINKVLLRLLGRSSFIQNIFNEINKDHVITTEKVTLRF